jgi:hypothetical protein
VGSVTEQATPNRRKTVGTALSRRKFAGALGVAAAGTAAGAALSQRIATAAQAATVEQGALAPAVVALVDGATIVVDASQGNDFRVTIAGNRTMGNPANPVDGQQIIFQVTQGGAGSFQLTWSNSYEFSQAMPQPSLSTAPGHTDIFGFIYNAAVGSWLLAAFVNGFN